MTSAEMLQVALITVEANQQFTEAVIRFRDNSQLCFCHRVGARWAKAVGSSQSEDEAGIAAELLSAMTMFRLNAKHLEIEFTDDSRWEEKIEPVGDASDRY